MASELATRTWEIQQYTWNGGPGEKVYGFAEQTNKPVALPRIKDGSDHSSVLNSLLSPHCFFKLARVLVTRESATFRSNAVPAIIIISWTTFGKSLAAVH